MMKNWRFALVCLVLLALSVSCGKSPQKEKKPSHFSQGLADTLTLLIQQVDLCLENSRKITDIMLVSPGIARLKPEDEFRIVVIQDAASDADLGLPPLVHDDYLLGNAKSLLNQKEKSSSFDNNSVIKLKETLEYGTVAILRTGEYASPQVDNSGTKGAGYNSFIPGSYSGVLHFMRIKTGAYLFSLKIEAENHSVVRYKETNAANGKAELEKDLRDAIYEKVIDSYRAVCGAEPIARNPL